MSATQHAFRYESRSILTKISRQPALGAVPLWVFEAKAQQDIQRRLGGEVPGWQMAELDKKEQSLFRWTTQTGPIFLLRTQPIDGSWEAASDFGRGRDGVGAWARENMFSAKAIEISFFGLSTNYVKGALHGLGLASLESHPKKRQLPQLHIRFNGNVIDEELVNAALVWSDSQNIARHLVNRPGSEVNPKSFSDFVRKSLGKTAGVKIKILGPEELRRQGYGLIYGVGQGALHGAHLVHLSYRPKGAKGKPVAIVGKGVTFDTGGLDIKPAAGMRLMKKDMAGAATVFAVFKMAVDLKIKTPLDVYLALAENAISDRSMRPGDVLTAKNGLQVEIDNTDAEGRLVMADAICMAVANKETPAVLFDVSTLTGAMRVALGTDVAGFFSTDAKYTAKIEAASDTIGELAWEMPLVRRYLKSLKSPVADMANSSADGFGGAITAALFLEKFVGKIPWVHFDVMSWNRGPDGAMSEGGNGQCFQILAQYLTGWV